MLLSLPHESKMTRIHVGPSERLTLVLSSYQVNEPLLGSNDATEDRPYPPQHNRRRSRAKPGDLFIHPNESVFHADEVALEMGITGDTQRAKGSGYHVNERAREHEKRGDNAGGVLASSSS